MMETVKNVVESGKQMVGLGSSDWTVSGKVEDYYNILEGSKTHCMKRSTAGATTHQDLVCGTAPFQLYANGFPDSQKVAIMCEELGIQYDAHHIDVMNMQHFTSGFVSVNPGSKVPAACDKEGPNNTKVRLFESNSILLYLGEKSGQLLPQDPVNKAECCNWLFWQASNIGSFGTCFLHYWMSASSTQKQVRDYGIARYGMELQRCCSTLDNHLKGRNFIVADEFSIADIACFTWFQNLRSCCNTQGGMTIKDFLSLETNYPNVVLWANRILSRPSVQKGLFLFHDDMEKASRECSSTTSK